MVRPIRPLADLLGLTISYVYNHLEEEQIMSITYNPVTPEIIEAIQAAAPGHVLVGDAINEDFCHDEMSIYGKAIGCSVEATTPQKSLL